MKNGTTLVTGFGLAYADNLNLTGITDQVTAANSNVLSYTPANRLASASGAWGNKAYSYDGVGNRITDVTTGGSSISRTQYYSNTSNRLNDIWENGASLRVYTYDGAGNTLTESRPGEAFAYTYNKRNRLASVTRNGSLWGTYVYNAFEQLVSRTSPAPAAPLGTVHYIHDLDGHLIAEADGATGAVLRDYIWLPALAPRSLGVGGNDNEVQDLPLAVIDGVNTATPVTSFIHTDHLGRPTRMTNAAKVTVWQAVWTPWGEAQSMTGSVTNNLRFPGQYFQIETNLHYNHHRTYDPVTGRYTQPDPLGFVDGPSVYAYAGNSPWMNVDRSGLEMYSDSYVGPLPPDGWRESEGTRTICGIIPPHPPGQGPIQNMAEAARHWNPWWFKNMVRNKGPWDYKQLNRKYTDYGNFNFGASGSALGLPSSVLKRGAGWANSKADPSRKDFGSWYDWSGSYGDDPADQKWIDEGIIFCGCGRR